MLKVETLTVGQLQTNCYIVYCTEFTQDGSHEGIIIDPGDDASYCMQRITDLSVTPTAVVATHGHFDHTLAVTELKLAYKVPFLMHKADEFLLGRMRETTHHFTQTDPGPAPTIDIDLGKMDTLEIGECSLSILACAGHTPGSVALYSKEDTILMCGDLMFADGNVGRSDFQYANQTQLTKSIEALLKLPSATIVYPGHGESFQLGVFRSHY